MKKITVAEDIVFLSGNGNHPLGAEILLQLSELFGQRCNFSHINFNSWPDGERDDSIRDNTQLKGKVVVFYQSMFRENLMLEAMDIIHACKHQYGAKYIIGVFPFLWNRRQDPVMEASETNGRKVAKPQEFQRLRMLLSHLRHAGLDEMLVATPHSTAMAKYCQEFGIIFREIDPSHLFANALRTFVHEEDFELVKIYSPDLGSIGRAVELARILNCPVLFNEKNRAINSDTTVIDPVSDEESVKLVSRLRKLYDFENINYGTSELVNGRIVVMTEDEVASGGTANGTAKRLMRLGVKSVFLLATHAVLTPGWRNKLFSDDPFGKVILTNTIPRGYEKRTGGKIYDISLGGPFASKLYQALNRQ
jgi:phosphoribosylpyrophosphate synthetase